MGSLIPDSIGLSEKKRVNLTIKFGENNTKYKNLNYLKEIFQAVQCVHVRDLAWKLKVACTLQGVSRVTQQ